METLLFVGGVLLVAIAILGAWHGIQALRLSAKIQGGSRRLMRLAGWNLLEPLISTIVAVPFAIWGLAWTFNCGMNGTRGCNKILTGLIWFVPFIVPIVLLVLPVLLQRSPMLEPWQSGKSRIVQLGLIRFVLIVLTCVGFFFAYINYVIVTAGFVFLVYSLLEIIKIVQLQKAQSYSALHIR
jgi:hypothetical protein